MLLPEKVFAAPGDVTDKKIEKVEKLEKEKSDLDKKNTDRLIKAVTGLSNTLVKVEKDARNGAKGDIGRMTIGGLLSNAKDTVKKFTSARGIIGTLAENTRNPLMGTILGSAAEKLDKKHEARQKQEQFVSTVMNGTAFGRQFEKNDVEGINAVKEKYQQKTKLEIDLAGKKAARDRIISEGKEAGIEADVSDADKSEIQRIENDLKDIADSLKIAADSLQQPKESEDNIDKPKQKSSKVSEESDKPDAESEPIPKEMLDELIAGVKEGIIQAYNEMSPEEKDVIDKADPNYVEDAIQGALDELNNISKDQLDKLIAIQTALEVSDEDKLEAKAKDKLIPEKEEKDENKSPSLMGKLMKYASNIFKGPLGQLSKLFSNIPGLLMKALTPLASMLGGLVTSAVQALAPIAAPLAAVAAAGAAGAWVGSKISDKFEEVTGNSSGSTLYDGVQWLKGAVGMETDADVIKAAENKADIEYGKKKIAAGESVGANVAAKMKEAGIEVPEDHIKKDTKPTAREIDNALSKKETDTAVPIEKTQQTAQTQLRQVDNDLEKQEQLKKQQSDTVNIVNAPKTINNNNTTQNIVKPVLRNEEPQYLGALNRRLQY